MIKGMVPWLVKESDWDRADPLDRTWGQNFQTATAVDS